MRPEGVDMQSSDAGWRPRTRHIDMDGMRQSVATARACMIRLLQGLAHSKTTPRPRGMRTNRRGAQRTQPSAEHGCSSTNRTLLAWICAIVETKLHSVRCSLWRLAEPHDQHLSSPIAPVDVASMPVTRGMSYGSCVRDHVRAI